MRGITILITCLIFFGCEQKEQEPLELRYIQDGNKIYLNFSNNSNNDIVFLVPNTLEFGDKNYKSLSTRGSMEGDYPINVYALIQPALSQSLYQKKYDRIYNDYLTEIGNGDFIGDEKPGDGNSVFI